MIILSTLLVDRIILYYSNKLNSVSIGNIGIKLKNKYKKLLIFFCPIQKLVSSNSIFKSK